MLARAWGRVKDETIAKCFRACGFVETSGDASCPPAEVQLSELDDGSFGAALGDVRFEEHVTVDSTVETCGPLTDSEIVQIVRPHECIHESDANADDDIENEPQPRAADLAAGLREKATSKKHLDTSTAYKTCLPQLDSASRSRRR
ncbi:hypothetical protein HPB49_014202 [Dermacentor silvarum]|uniref:Uncharacterized protein n=1 Tax=Dermacentor silvarum TaxID=543639 RepID=A0ACB8E160_DERSI|nr:hypothetical protein HPB49_014202 [Dermacentor silvarum]